MKTITNTRFDEERALYGAQNVLVRDCAFDGPADGESAFKEGRDIQTTVFSICAIPSGIIRASKSKTRR